MLRNAQPEWRASLLNVVQLQFVSRFASPAVCCLVRPFLPLTLPLTLPLLPFASLSAFRFCKRAGLVDGQVIIFAHGELSGSHKPLSVRAGDRTVLAPIVNVSTVNLPPPDEEGRPQMTPAKAEWRNFVAGVWAVFREAEARENGEIDL